MCGSKFVCVFITYLAFVPRIFCDNPFVDLIIDGTQAKTKEFPAMVSIQFKYRNYHICGGSLIGWNHILTAAHCVVWKNEITGTYTTLDPLVFQIMAGDIRIDDGSFSRQIRYASQLIPHPAFDPQIIENDVAVIRVYPRFTETPYVNLITLDKSTPKPNRLCVISGWGTTKENVLNSSPHVLRKTEVEIKSMHFCNSDSSYGEILPKFTICAGSIGSENLNAKNKEDSCQGDSGGPLMCGHRLTGIVSFGRGCGEVRYPGVYTDVSEFRSWIEDVCNHAIVKRCSGINLIIQWVILYKM